MTFKESDQAKSGKTLRDGYVSFGHPSVMLKLGSGESVEIDKGVIDLIKLMNSIPGIETKGSCQGQDPNYGYVQFMPDDTASKDSGFELDAELHSCAPFVLETAGAPTPNQRGP